MLTALQKAKFDNTSPFENLDKVLNQKRGVIRATWDFAVNGGTGAMLLSDENGDPAVLPVGAIVTQAYIYVVTAAVSTGNNGTMALSLNAANDILSAVDADTLTIGTVNAGVPVGTAATMVVIATSPRRLTATVATNNMTAGKWFIFLEFVLAV